MKRVWKYTTVMLCMNGLIFATDKLRVFEETHPEKIIQHTSDNGEISETLHEIGVRFEQWEANKELSATSTSEEILDAYRVDVDKLIQENGFKTVDVLKALPTMANRETIRAKFLNEHTHSEGEVRFFVEGSGLFYLHAKNRVYLVRCDKGDLISIPPKYEHWFDMGSEPNFAAIRFFVGPEGWVANFTGNQISNHFPKFDDKVYSRKSVAAILTDIEGTTTSISFVHDVLFPYAKKNVAQFLTAHQNEPAITQVIQEVKAVAQTPNADLNQVIATLQTWMEQDRKVTPLKTLQGIMWEDGYVHGDFEGHLYQDAYEQLKNWKKQENLPLYVYSSGSVQAQKLLFSHSNYGDVTPFFSNYFDTKVGGKKESTSYATIAQQIGVAPQEVLFLSDTIDELNAARAAGMQTLLLSRDAVPSDTSHPFVTTFDQIGFR